MNMSILIAGFGGQGVLFTGKVLATAGLLINKEVSWFPSYGPEMRGGTVNCGVIISDDPVGLPIVSAPDVLIAMNPPSYEKFAGSVVPGGVVIIDSSLIEKTETESKTIGIPATKMAADNDLSGLSNIVILGKFLKTAEIFKMEDFEKAIEKSVSARKSDMLEKNMKALRLGYDFEE